MAQFATAVELAQYLGRSIAAGTETDHANKVLQAASALIQVRSGQRIELVPDDQAKLRGTWDDELRLPQRPVLAVTSVQIDTEPVLASSTYAWDRLGLLRLKTGFWAGAQAIVAVTYSHGYAVIPDDIKLVCLALAARAVDNPTAVASETLGRYTATHEHPGLTLAPDELAVLKRYRRRP